MIAGVKITKLKQIVDERGKVMHMLKRTDPVFQRFGEIYFSTVHSGIIKGWHLHKKMTLNYTVPYGKIRLVLYDGRQNSKTKGKIMKITISPKNYYLVTVPPGIWNAFAGLGKTDSIVANCATIPHDPEEIIRLDPYSDKIPYEWK
ncbi:dTDP-4-dehydrorhamnose 3,5-epimerase family protein [Candidatus Microgenomates bacterium]|nr:dTDP-4-dehydrorhamnose 3,5-epimerase family protein [Candidatus Microgenomates bacterium]